MENSIQKQLFLHIAQTHLMLKTNSTKLKQYVGVKSRGQEAELPANANVGRLGNF